MATDRVRHQKLTRFRHAVKAMKFAGVHQGDWHLDQVICYTPQGEGETPVPVLIDFAFAPQHLGENGTPCRGDVTELSAILLDMGVSATVIKECWFDAVWQEY